jgi:hypothetical protein
MSLRPLGRRRIILIFILKTHTTPISYDTVKAKAAIPLQALSGPEGSRRLWLPDLRQSAYEGGKVVSPTHQPPLPPVNIPGTDLC